MPVPIDEDNVYTLIELSLQLSHEGKTTASEQLLLYCLEVLEKEQDRATELRSTVMHMLANIMKKSGKAAVSKAFYLKAFSLLKESSRQLIPLSLYEDLYCHYLSDLDLTGAMELQMDLFQYHGQSAGARIRERNIMRLAAFSWHNEDYAGASNLLDKYLLIKHQSANSAKQNSPFILELQALFAFRQKQYEKAELLLNELLKQDREMSPLETAEALSRLGLVLCAQGKESEAETQCRQAASLREKSPEDNETEATKLREIADLYCLQNCKEEAAGFCESALESAQAKAGNHQVLAAIFRKLNLPEDAELLLAAGS